MHVKKTEVLSPALYNLIKILAIRVSNKDLAKVLPADQLYDALYPISIELIKYIIKQKHRSLWAMLC